MRTMPIQMKCSPSPHQYNFQYQLCHWRIFNYLSESITSHLYPECSWFHPCHTCTVPLSIADIQWVQRGGASTIFGRLGLKGMKMTIIHVHGSPLVHSICSGIQHYWYSCGIVPCNAL